MIEALRDSSSSLSTAPEIRRTRGVRGKLATLTFSSLLFFGGKEMPVAVLPAPLPPAGTIFIGEEENAIARPPVLSSPDFFFATDAEIPTTEIEDQAIEGLGIEASEQVVFEAENDSIQIFPAQEESVERASMALKTNYSFKTFLDYDSARISTTEEVYFVNNSGGKLSKLNFSVPPAARGEFVLKTVKVNAKTIDPAWSNPTNLVIDLGLNLGEGDSSFIEITFENIVKSDISTSLNARLSKANGIMQVSQWFPIISDGHAMRYPGDSQYTATADNFHLDLTLNREMVVAAPGNKTTPTPLTRVIDFGPARDFAFSVCPNCKSSTAKVDDIEVNSYYLPGSAGKTALRNAVSSLQGFIDKFGDYPYSNFTIAQATRPAAGNEYPGIVFIGSSNLGSLNVIRHETAHQWFYGLLGNDQLNEPWLDEAFAEWAGDGFTSHKYCSSRLVSSPIYDFSNTPANLTNRMCNSYDQTIYYKGASFIQGVRRIMGDGAFFNSLKDLFLDNRFGIITTETVVSNWLDHADPSLQDKLSKLIGKYIQ